LIAHGKNVDFRAPIDGLLVIEVAPA
jgi:hypothetical protein